LHWVYSDPFSPPLYVFIWFALLLVFLCALHSTP
jgi:hypothetical protein